MSKVDAKEQELVSNDAVIQIMYDKGSAKLSIDNTVPQWFADAMAVRYLELMRIWKDRS